MVITVILFTKRGLIPSISLRANIVPIQLNEDGQQVILSIDSIIFNEQNIPQNIQTICVHSLEIKITGYSKVWVGYETKEFLFEEEICKPKELISPSSNTIYMVMYDKEKDKTPSLSEPLYLDNDPFYYPYDNFELQIAAFISISFIDETGQTVKDIAAVPDLYIKNVGGEDWDRTVSTPTHEYFWSIWSTDRYETYQNTTIVNKGAEDIYKPLIANGINEPFLIRYSRSFVVRTVFPIIGLTFLVIIYLLAIAESLDIFLAGAIAVLVGLFGIREVLIPINVHSRNLIDIVIMGLYVLFATSTFIQFYSFISGYYRQRNGSNKLPLETIDASNGVQITKPQIPSIEGTIKSQPKQSILVSFLFLSFIGILGWILQGRNKSKDHPTSR